MKRYRRRFQFVRAKSVGLEAAAGLEHGDAVSLLRQPQRRDAAAEPAAYDEHVHVERTHASRVLWAAAVRRLALLLLLLLFASTATAATIRGTKTANLIIGTPTPDHIIAGAGNDLVQAAFGGTDSVNCGAGIDIVSADAVDKVASNCEIVSRRLSVDPYKNPDSQHETAVEPDSFAWGDTVVAVFQVGRRANGAAANIGTAMSRDDGRTWTRALLPGTTVNAVAARPRARRIRPERRLRRGARSVDREHADARGQRLSHIYIVPLRRRRALVCARRRSGRPDPRQGVDHAATTAPRAPSRAGAISSTPTIRRTSS